MELTAYERLVLKWCRETRRKDFLPTTFKSTLGPLVETTVRPVQMRDWLEWKMTGGQQFASVERYGIIPTIPEDM